MTNKTWNIFCIVLYVLKCSLSLIFHKPNILLLIAYLHYILFLLSSLFALYFISQSLFAFYFITLYFYFLQFICILFYFFWAVKFLYGITYMWISLTDKDIRCSCVLLHLVHYFIVIKLSFFGFGATSLLYLNSLLCVVLLLMIFF